MGEAELRLRVRLLEGAVHRLLQQLTARQQASSAARDARELLAGRAQRLTCECCEPLAFCPDDRQSELRKGDDEWLDSPER